LFESNRHGNGDRNDVKLVRRWLLVVLSSALYFGLAVLRCGLEYICAQPALIALAIVGLVMVLLALVVEVSLSSGVQEDRSNRWVIGAFGVSVS